MFLSVLVLILIIFLCFFPVYSDETVVKLDNIISSNALYKDKTSASAKIIRIFAERVYLPRNMRAVTTWPLSPKAFTLYKHSLNRAALTAHFAIYNGNMQTFFVIFSGAWVISIYLPIIKTASLWQWYDHSVMTSSNQNIFRVTGPLCGEFTGPRWTTRTKASDAELWYFLWTAPWIYGWVNNREVGDLRRHRAQYDVIVMAVPAWYQTTSTHNQAR